jgi:MFS family permease
MAADTGPGGTGSARWFSRGVAGIGTSSFLADLGHEIPTALLPSLLTITLHAPASALGLIEGISDAAGGVSRLAGGALADDPGRRRRVAVGGYATTAVLSAAIGAAAAPWQAGVLRAGAWAARGLRVPARNASSRQSDSMTSCRRDTRMLPVLVCVPRRPGFPAHLCPV